MMGEKLSEVFFEKDALEIAPQLLGCYLVRQYDSGEIRRYRITEVEVYRGEEDKACHAHRGKTPRMELLYGKGGKIYVYLIYGLYWLLNIVTGQEGHPQGIMIRAVEKVNGPGRVGRVLALDATFKGESIQKGRLWIESSGHKVDFTTAPRVGIEYAREWKDRPWRYILKNPEE